MSRLDYCKYELVGDCYDWKNDNCDRCNIFKAYCEGARRAKKAQNNAQPTHGRLIDADALMKELSDIQPYNWTESEAEIQEEADYSLFKILINSAPTVQAEAVHKPDYSYEADMARRLIEETLKNKLQELAQCDDYEMAHREADELLCDFITKLGYGEVAQKFDAVPRWYA